MTRKDTHEGLRVGDWVIVKPSYVVKTLTGKVGRVVNIVDRSVGVDFGANITIDPTKRVSLHNLNAEIHTRTGWYIPIPHLELSKNTYLNKYFNV